MALREDGEGRVYAAGARQENVDGVPQLLRLLAHGTKRRATAATGVHEHSSRSHAILTLALEHRWREPAEADPRAFLRTVSRLTLADLAGSETMEHSHGGRADRAGCATNFGLGALLRVVTARAQGSAHVPYRDSVLTRLLATNLGPESETVLIGCVSPSAEDAQQSLATLGYCARMRGLQQFAPAQCPLAEVDETDPMAMDSDDPDKDYDRRTVRISTSFGDVFARVLGGAALPLILYVHGSGPRNSSRWWFALMQDVAAQAPNRFMHVAIDCPGYGRSDGDRQIIRSYPAQFLAEVVAALGKSSAACLVGSSQGAAAVQNAIIERPKLAQSLALCDPVSMDLTQARYASIAVPVLMLYDTEDAGHPVSVGRKLRKMLQRPRYIEYASSRDGDVRVSLMASELLLTIDSARVKAMPSTTKIIMAPRFRVAGGISSFTEAHGAEFQGWSSVQARPEEIISMSDVNAKGEDLFDEPPVEISEADRLKLEHKARETSARVKAKQMVVTVLAEGRPCIALDFGCKAKPSSSRGDKTQFTTWLSCSSHSALHRSTSSRNISSVSFNINPSYAKPTKLLREPNDSKLGFSFDYEMARLFPCHITVTFKQLRLTISIPFDTSVLDVARKVVVQLPKAGASGSGKRNVKAVFDATEPVNGIIRMDEGGARVKHL